MFPFWFPTQSITLEPEEPSETVKIFYANVHSDNDSKELLVDYLTESSPEIVMLVETDMRWAMGLRPLQSVYPYSKAIFQNGNFGLAVLSQHPLEIEKVFTDRENKVPALYLSFADNRFRALVLHAFPPIGQYGSLLRNRYLRTIAGVLAEDPGPLLVCGDFNTTPWTSIFEKFVNVSGLRRPEHVSLIRTWPTGLLPALPIDHCLSKNMIVKQYARGPDIGSDHWPLELRISIPARSPTSWPSKPQ